MINDIFSPGMITRYPVPEVSTLILLGVALVALALVARWKLKNKK